MVVCGRICRFRASLGVRPLELDRHRDHHGDFDRGGKPKLIGVWSVGETARWIDVDEMRALRALAYKWIRIVYRCWQTRTAYDESTYLLAFKRRRSPLI